MPPSSSRIPAAGKREAAFGSSRGRSRPNHRVVGAAVLAIFGCLLSIASCANDVSEDSSTDPGGACPEGGGPVAGPADAHCIAEDGTPIVQGVGECATEVDEAASSAPDDEEYFISYGGESDDDDCKY